MIRLTDEDREWIYERAHELYRKWEGNGVRGQMTMPQDSIEYHIMTAAAERLSDLKTVDELKGIAQAS